MKIHHSFGKQLLLQKININEHKDKKNHLERIFSDPNYYFSNKFNGHNIIIGKKHSKNIISRSNSKKKSIKKNHRFSIISLKNDSKKKDMPKITTNLNLNPNQIIIDHNELKQIYKRFKTINEKNSIENKKNKYKDKDRINFVEHEFTNEINDKKYKTIKTEIEHDLNFQEEVLLKKKNEDLKIENISKKLSIKLKRPISKLLMKNNEEYRTKKEIQYTFYKEVKNSIPEPNYKWTVNLRDNDNHYLNEGSIKNPYWTLYINKKENEENEKIRNPDFFYTTKSTFYQRNQYLKGKIPHKTFYTLNKDLNNTNSQFSQICVKGKKLLDFEIENSQYLKGRKIILTNHPFGIGNSFLSNVINLSDKSLKNEMYKKNVDFKSIRRKKKALSCVFDN